MWNPGAGQARACSKSGFGRFRHSEGIFTVRGLISSTSVHRSSFPPTAYPRHGVPVAPSVRRRGDRCVGANFTARDGARSSRCYGCSPRSSTVPSTARSLRVRRKEPCRGSGVRDCNSRFRSRVQAVHLRILRPRSRAMTSTSVCLSRDTYFLRV